MSTLINDFRCIGEGETRNVAVNFDGTLESGELLSAISEVVEVTTTGFTIANEAVNTAILSINNENAAIGKAAQFKISGGDTTGLTVAQANTLGAGESLYRAGLASVQDAASGDYTITAIVSGVRVVKITATTDATPAQTVIQSVALRVVGDSA